MVVGREQKEAVRGIKQAIQMEIDGKKYYGQASKRSNNKLGKELFLWLAAEEDKHRLIFVGIFDSISKQKGWPEVSINPTRDTILETVFSEAMRAAAATAKSTDKELDSIAGAMDMENKTREFYRDQSQKVSSESAKKLYSALAAEERGHYLALVDYREYLINPAGYFVKTEHHSLDGG